LKEAVDPFETIQTFHGCYISAQSRVLRFGSIFKMLISVQS